MSAREDEGMDLDWGDGDYGRTAEVLEPASEIVVELAGVSEGDRVLDVACGTGNATIAAAVRGAGVVGVDLSEGLLGIARGRADAAGLPDVVLRAGDAVDLPVEQGSFDVALSVFGVIFATDADAAVANMLAAVRPGGVIAIASWISRGPICAAGMALRKAFPSDSGTEAFDWTRPEGVRGLLERTGAREIAQSEHELEFRAPSAAEWFDEQQRNHPVWRWAGRQLPAERWAEVRRESVEALRAGSDEPLEFRARSPYVITRAVR
ncbi:MAG: class I SAM-dependent methyltransferase [Thermoleophilia bacterium]|nr:class I SAM-dependent methyltransferase [Thermoleophilia bacterium]